MITEYDIKDSIECILASTVCDRFYTGKYTSKLTDKDIKDLKKEFTVYFSNRWNGRLDLYKVCGGKVKFNKFVKDTIVDKLSRGF